MVGRVVASLTDEGRQTGDRHRSPAAKGANFPSRSAGTSST